MPNCYFCEIKIIEIPYRCKFCGMIFCNKHRLPENHKCPFDLRKKNKFFDSLDKPLYLDALDFMIKDLTVAKVYDYVTANQMNKAEAIELLNSFLERSDNKEIRKTSILAFKILELKSDKAYSVLESCILSDEDPEVIKVAVEVMKFMFPKKSKDLLNWMSNHNKRSKD